MDGNTPQIIFQNVSYSFNRLNTFKWYFHWSIMKWSLKELMDSWNFLAKHHTEHKVHYLRYSDEKINQRSLELHHHTHTHTHTDPAWMIILLICFKHFSQLSELKGVFMGDKKDETSPGAGLASLDLHLLSWQRRTQWHICQKRNPN